MAIKYKRVLIKVSGEALAGDDRFGVNDTELGKVAAQIKEIRDAGVEVAVVVGGGNFFRGRTGGNIDKPTADYMGMLATVMNGLAVQDALLAAGCPAKLMTAIEIRDMAEGYARRKALDYLEEGKVVVFGGGTGSPFFTTDTTAALRAAEIGADVLLLAKNIDAVYSADPKQDPDAERYTELSYMDCSNALQGYKDQDICICTQGRGQSHEGYQRRKCRNTHTVGGISWQRNHSKRE